MVFSPLVDDLITALRCLPGVGQRTATRMALHLLERNRNGAQNIITKLTDAIKSVKKCELCNIWSENTLCTICANTKRDNFILCVVGSPLDVLAIEQSCVYKGLYYVLFGNLSPIDGIGPDELGLTKLKERLEKSKITEVILATNATVEGEATAYYLSTLINSLGIKTSRIARGIPMGGELEYLDSTTVMRAVLQRETI